MSARESQCSVAMRHVLILTVLFPSLGVAAPRQSAKDLALEALKANRHHQVARVIASDPYDGAFRVEVIVGKQAYRFRYDKKADGFVASRKRSRIKPGKRRYTNAKTFLKMIASDESIQLREECGYTLSAGNSTFLDAQDIDVWQRRRSQAHGKAAVRLVGKAMQQHLAKRRQLEVEYADAGVIFRFHGNKVMHELTLVHGKRGHVTAATLVEKKRGWQNASYKPHKKLLKDLRSKNLTSVQVDAKSNEVILTFTDGQKHVIANRDFQHIEGCAC